MGSPRGSGLLLMTQALQGELESETCLARTSPDQLCDSSRTHLPAALVSSAEGMPSSAYRVQMCVLGQVMGGSGTWDCGKNTASHVMTVPRAHSEDVVVLVMNAAVWAIPLADCGDCGI